MMRSMNKKLCFWLRVLPQTRSSGQGSDTQRNYMNLNISQ
jgi:hypothetical protein